MRIVHVDLGSKSYDIEIERGLLITDSHVGPLYASLLQESLEKEGVAVAVLTFPAGEESKNLQTLGSLYDGLAEAGLTRSDAVVALGGGVTGDMGGLAAATFLRGIAFVQIPTSLLATVDSSVGGKVAIDLSSGKNLVGAFYQPKVVFIDPELLKTLPVRYLHDGLAEVIKYGCIMDKELFMMLEKIQNDTELLARADEIIETCCNIKARIVEHDEFDTGERMLLNFGHTLGHAVEKTFHFDKYSHGEGVGIGMVLLTRRSEKLPDRCTPAEIPSSGYCGYAAGRFPAGHCPGQKEARFTPDPDSGEEHRGKLPAESGIQRINTVSSVALCFFSQNHQSESFLEKDLL